MPLRLLSLSWLMVIAILASFSVTPVVATQLGQICRMQCQQRYSLCQQQMSGLVLRLALTIVYSPMQLAKCQSMYQVCIMFCPA